MNEHEQAIISAFFPREDRARVKKRVDENRLRWLNHFNGFDARYAHWFVRTSDVEKLSEKWFRNHKRISVQNSVKDDEYPYIWDSLSKAIIRFLKENGCQNKVYVMSLTEDLNGKSFSLEEALSRTIHGGWGTIISCIPGKLAFYRDEVGERKAFLIRED